MNFLDNTGFDVCACKSETVRVWHHQLFAHRELEKKEKERKDKEKEEKRRLERKNRDAFKELLKSHREDGTIVPKMKWKV